MASADRPSVGQVLKSLNRKSADEVHTKAQNYLSHYDGSKGDVEETVEERKTNSLEITHDYYDLATDFFEYGWGESFHFSVVSPGETREQSLAKYEFNLALRLGLKKNDLVLDAGCGIGGPARRIASFSEAKVIGLNYNNYQLNRARVLTKKSNLEHLCSYVQGDFHNIPFDDNHFDKAYAIEATCHSPDLSKVYGEIFRVLKPGGLFACCEWVMTDKYDPKNSYHRKLKADIMEGDGLPDIVSIPDVHRAVKKVGFEIVEARDRSLDSLVPWHSVLQPRWTLSDIKTTPVGRWVTHLLLMALETIRLAPKGSVQVHRMLCKGADGLAAGGREGIFSPLYLLLLRKPENPKA